MKWAFIDATHIRNINLLQEIKTKRLVVAFGNFIEVMIGDGIIQEINITSDLVNLFDLDQTGVRCIDKADDLDSLPEQKLKNSN